MHAHEQPPQDWSASVFLAGPTPRTEGVESWRPEAIAELHRRWTGAGRLVVFSPEPRDGRWASEYVQQLVWEKEMIDCADQVIFWVPRDLAAMPAFTTNVEFGMLCDSGRVVFGAPPAAPKNRYLRQYAVHYRAPVADTLSETIGAALERIGTGALRRNGEREVPLLLWQLPGFQNWYAAQQGAGNTLLRARVGWTRRIGAERSTVLYWALHVRLRVASEDRVKEEVLFARPDLAVVALYNRPSPGGTDDIEVVLVREVRVPATTSDGYVRELPGGAVMHAADPQQQALAELAEETGLTIPPDRLRYHGCRQLVGAMSAHHAYLYSAELHADELEQLRQQAGRPHGNLGEGEQTFTEIVRYGCLYAVGVDWTTIGMISQVVGDLNRGQA